MRNIMFHKMNDLATTDGRLSMRKGVLGNTSNERGGPNSGRLFGNSRTGVYIAGG